MTPAHLKMSASIKLPFSFKDTVLATGPELKNSFAILSGDTVFVSNVFDDLKDPNIFESFKRAILAKKRELGIGPKIVACDLHPEYVSTKYARWIYESLKKRVRKIRLEEVQHHHAHIASCMAEHGLRSRIIGVAFDGMGYGSDGNIWGGEFLVADYQGFKRVAHLEYVPMPGADKAVLEPARMAFAYIYRTYKGRIGNLKSGVLKRIGKERYSLFAEMVDKDVNSPLTSSAGRLFDAVSSLAGVRDSISYEDEAAIELEKMAAVDCNDAYKFEIKTAQDKLAIVFWPMIRSIVSDIRNRKPLALVARKFHNTLAEAIKETCSRIRMKARINKVALSGGVFQNKILSQETRKRLEKSNFLVYTHSKTSCADRSLSLGQAVIAATKVNSNG